MTNRRLLSAVVTLVAATTFTSGAVAAAPDTLAKDRAAAWLETQSIDSPGQMADAIVALRAAGRTGTLSRRIDELSRVAGVYATTAGGAGKVALAASAAGRNPRNLGGVDYIARITARYRSGRYGTSSYDQAYSMIALSAAGVGVPSAAIRRLRTTRGAGGWGFSLSGGRDDPSSTGLLMEAARASGVAPSDPMLRQAATWLVSQANSEGGFNLDRPRGRTQANSTAIALRAWRTTGRRPPSSWRRALRSLQEADGGVRFTARIRESRYLATVDSLVAFSGRPLPAFD